ncbi:MAG: M28 family peptidase [Planctomycetales bacterium]|nr:M28 family peptidase [bacterium]UNM09578.1 MAG: M28 family peptidase [Planctomycetales bacterium]
MDQLVRGMAMRVSFNALTLLCTVLLLAASIRATAAFDELRYRDSVEYLSSDELEGRMSGTPGGEKAAHYIADIFIDCGLEPAGVDGSFMQPFDFTSGVVLGDGNSAQWGAHGQNTSWELGTDWTPLHFCPDGQVASGIIFVGYGITAEDFGYDDYEGLDVKGKIVAVLRHEPQTDDEAMFAGRRMSHYGDLRYKAQNAYRHGAAALVVVTGPNDRLADPGDPLMELGSGDVYGEAPIPVVQLKAERLQELMTFWEGDLAKMQDTMDTELMPQSLDMSYLTVELNTDLERTFSKTDNVVGLLRGSELPDEYIVVGAHYDHLGHGEARTSLTPEELNALSWHDRIHHGADDNASGTAGVLELARHFSEHGSRRSILLICFSGEELGILGSLHYVRNATVPLGNCVAMLNMDMIGRVKDQVITVQGLGSAEEWAGILDSASAASGLEVKRFDDGVGGSDYTAFYTQQLPVLNFFSGLHEQYHTPADTADLLNYEGAMQVVGIVSGVIDELNSLDGKLTFTEDLSPQINRQGSGEVDTGRGYKVSLGTIPDYSYLGGDGVLLAGVRQNSPASEAGLQAGDRLVKMGESVIRNIYDFTYALEEHKPGDVVEIVVVREGVELTLSAELKGRG